MKLGIYEGEVEDIPWSNKYEEYMKIIMKVNWAKILKQPKDMREAIIQHCSLSITYPFSVMPPEVGQVTRSYDEIFNEFFHNPQKRGAVRLTKKWKELVSGAKK